LGDVRWMENLFKPIIWNLSKTKKIETLLNLLLMIHTEM